VTLKVVGGPKLGVSIEILDETLAPGEVRRVYFNLPEKNAKESSWSAFPLTEEGPDMSFEFEIGNMNPHSENPVTCFEAVLSGNSKYSIAVYNGGSESGYGIYEPE